MFQSVCQKNTCTLSLSSSLFVGSNPTVRCKTYRQWLGFVLRDAKRTVHEIVCENVFIQTFVIIRQSESASVHLAEQCKSKPCLRVDTVLSQTVPKDFFPHCAGGTQIFSRCFCMNDSGIKRNYDWSDYIMLFFFPTKRNKLLSKLIKAFPKEYTADVKAV